MKRALLLISLLLQMVSATQALAIVEESLETVTNDKVVVAYVTSWTRTIPDPSVMTHLNYAFGHVTDTYDGVRVDNPERLRKMVALKKKAPQLKVLLSIGGWGSGRFSEMAANDSLRLSFAHDARRVADEFGLDGIDIDWEYPTQSSAGISSSPRDTHNFTLLMRDLRLALGEDRLLTIATVASGEYIDLRACVQYINLVNVMSYDMASAPKHHSALYPSDISGWMTTSQAVDAHLRAGVPREKLVMGMPLYGRGLRGNDADPQKAPGITEHWNELSMVPYLTDSTGCVVMGFENERSLGIKCQYILEHGLRGGMYGEYGDDHQAPLRQTICDILMRGQAGPYPADYAGKRVRFRALLLWEPGAESAHVDFDRQAIQFFHKLSYGEGFTYDVRTVCPDALDTLRKYDVVVMLNTLPGSPAQRRAFEQYMEQGGGWLGFHATAYNDRNTHWPWLNDFLGCGPFLCNTWPPQPALVDVEGDEWHPVTRSLPRQFVAPASEFYQFSPSPRANKDVEVLVSISPKNYPMGIKDIVTHGDFPIVWTNTKYRMVYLNMGHGDEAFIDATQNLLFTNAFRWVAFSNKK